MNDSIKYKVQDTHIVCFNSNEIYKATPVENQKKVIKVEPRIMEVLQILIEHQSRLVKREYLIKKVWDDYPSSDDALNQAISHLRKLLEDNDKDNRIIETVVKKGYRFKGAVKPISEEKYKKKKFKVSKHLIYLLIGLLVLIIFLLIFYFQIFPDEAIAPVAPRSSLN